MVKVSLTDLQTRRVYHGVMRGEIIQGRDFDVELEKSTFRIVRVRGWLISQTNETFYLFDIHGKRFKLCVKQTIVDVQN